MKTNLTLKAGSFYFLSSVNLMRNIAAEVDLAVLTEAELRGLKAYVNAGSIQSSEDISGYSIPGTEELPEAPVEVEVEEAPTAPEQEEEATEAQPEAPETEEVVEEESEIIHPTDSKEADYEQFTAKELKALVKERDLTTKATSKRDLVTFLEEEDKNAK